MDSVTPERARSAGNARALARAALVVLALVAIAAAAVWAVAERRWLAAGASKGAVGAFSGPLPPSLDIRRPDLCSDPWARFSGCARPLRGERFCSGYGDPMWGGASDRENFSPDAPGTCSPAVCIPGQPIPQKQKDLYAAQLEQGALCVAAGSV